MSGSDKEKQKHYVRAAYAPDGPGADAMIALLAEHGIDAVKQGGVKDIYKIGGDVFGEEIMVSPEDLGRAQILLQQPQAAGKAPDPKSTSGKKAVLSLIAAAILFVILLFLRGKLML